MKGVGVEVSTNGHWHLDKRVSVGHLVTTAAVVATFVVWLMSLDGEITVAQRDIDAIRKSDEAHEQVAQQQFLRLEGRIESQTARLEGRMEAQYKEIIRRLEILDQRLADHSDGE